MRLLKTILVSGVASCALLVSAMAEERLTDYVNPFVGSSNFGTTNPGAVCPFLLYTSPSPRDVEESR